MLSEMLIGEYVKDKELMIHHCWSMADARQSYSDHIISQVSQRKRHSKMVFMLPAGITSAGSRHKSMTQSQALLP